MTTIDDLSMLSTEDLDKALSAIPTDKLPILWQEAMERNMTYLAACIEVEGNLRGQY